MTLKTESCRTVQDSLELLHIPFELRAELV